MKLYYSALSTECRKVRVVAAGLALQLELIDVNGSRAEPDGLDAGSQASLSPVPTLVDGKAVLRTANAILQYLANRTPVSPLWPDNSALRADIAYWLVWDAVDFSPAVHTAARRASIDPERISGVFPSGESLDGFTWFHRFAGVLNAHLSKHEYLVGGGATLADYSVVATLSFAEHVPLPLERYAEIRRWRHQLEQRPPMRSVPVPVAQRAQLAGDASKGPCHY